MQSLYKCIKCLIIVVAVLSTVNCTKLVDIPAPKNHLADKNVFSSNETAISVLTGIYTEMSGFEPFTGLESMSILTALAADELTADNNFASITHLGYYLNSLSVNGNLTSVLWRTSYNYIYKCNAALEGLESTEELTPAVKQQLIGESKFLRAFFYFYLTNL